MGANGFFARALLPVWKEGYKMNAALWLLAATTAAREPETAGEIMGGAGMTALIGLVVVFALLIILTLIFVLFGKVVGRASGRSAAAPAPEKAVQKPAAPAVKAAAPVPAVEDGISDEVVAVIAAAVAAMAPAGKAYAVRRVSASRPAGRPVWAMAGLLDNTRPF